MDYSEYEDYYYFGTRNESEISDKGVSKNKISETLSLHVGDKTTVGTLMEETDHYGIGTGQHVFATMIPYPAKDSVSPSHENFNTTSDNYGLLLDLVKRNNISTSNNNDYSFSERLGGYQGAFYEETVPIRLYIGNSKNPIVIRNEQDTSHIIDFVANYNKQQKLTAAVPPETQNIRYIKIEIPVETYSSKFSNSQRKDTEFDRGQFYPEDHRFNSDPGKVHSSESHVYLTESFREPPNDEQYEQFLASILDYSNEHNDASNSDLFSSYDAHVDELNPNAEDISEVYQYPKVESKENFGVYITPNEEMHFNNSRNTNSGGNLKTKNIIGTINVLANQDNLDDVSNINVLSDIRESFKNSNDKQNIFNVFKDLPALPQEFKEFYSDLQGQRTTESTTMSELSNDDFQGSHTSHNAKYNSSLSGNLQQDAYFHSPQNDRFNSNTMQDTDPNTKFPAKFSDFFENLRKSIQLSHLLSNKSDPLH